MLMKMNTLWFLNPSPDFEREQWTLMAYLRDAEKDLHESRLEPFYSDITKRLQDLECFLTTRTVVTDLSRSERKLLSIFNERSDDSNENQEVFKIVRFAQEKLQLLKKEYHNIWRKVESSFNLFYIGEKPLTKIDHGIMFIRYAGSHITEVYKFWNESGKAHLNHIEYSDEEYVDIQIRLDETNPNETYIIAESQLAFDTMITSMPFLVSTLEKKVMA